MDRKNSQSNKQTVVSCFATNNMYIGGDYSNETKIEINNDSDYPNLSCSSWPDYYIPFNLDLC